MGMKKLWISLPFISMGLIGFIYILSTTNDYSVQPKYQAQILQTVLPIMDTNVQKNSIPSRCIKSRPERLTALNQWCRVNYKETPANPQKFMLNALYVNDEYRIVYCHIPKTGCTNWKKYFILLSNKTNYTEVDQIKGSDAHSKLFNETVRKLSSYSTRDQSRILKTYFKFLIVRNPMTRLLSAYRNKFTKENPTFASFKKTIIKYYSTQNQTQEQPLFEDFLTFLTDPSGRNIHSNEHWQTFHELCNPCTINYDSVVQLETMEEDSAFIIDKIKSPYEFPRKRATTDKLVEEAFQDIKPSLLKRALDKYRDDMDSFGYNC